MIDADKIVDDKLITVDELSQEQPEDLKKRVSQRLQDILDMKIFKESETKAKRESEIFEEEKKAVPPVADEAKPVRDSVTVFGDASMI